ncbi:hypothetical protein B0H16DRAFT_1478396 [Mycena metata]|uniref:Uncharacterized protein n=1 Tax=Mycena metata TaxID=1033252 RepID=A0AAD7H6S8_9AGAR|nr:hypothetical protein B0H16DRAFT_1478396 [Mycena metata]
MSEKRLTSSLPSSILLVLLQSSSCLEKPPQKNLHWNPGGENPRKKSGSKRAIASCSTRSRRVPPAIVDSGLQDLCILFASRPTLYALVESKSGWARVSRQLTRHESLNSGFAVALSGLAALLLMKEPRKAGTLSVRGTCTNAQYTFRIRVGRDTLFGTKSKAVCGRIEWDGYIYDDRLLSAFQCQRLVWQRKDFAGESQKMKREEMINSGTLLCTLRHHGGGLDGILSLSGKSKIEGLAGDGAAHAGPGLNTTVARGHALAGINSLPPTRNLPLPTLRNSTAISGRGLVIELGLSLLYDSAVAADDGRTRVYCFHDGLKSQRSPPGRLVLPPSTPSTLSAASIVFNTGQSRTFCQIPPPLISRAAGGYQQSEYEKQSDYRVEHRGRCRAGRATRTGACPPGCCADRPPLCHSAIFMTETIASFDLFGAIPRQRHCSFGVPNATIFFDPLIDTLGLDSHNTSAIILSYPTLHATAARLVNGWLETLHANPVTRAPPYPATSHRSSDSKYLKHPQYGGKLFFWRSSFHHGPRTSPSPSTFTRAHFIKDTEPTGTANSPRLTMTAVPHSARIHPNPYLPVTGNGRLDALEEHLELWSARSVRVCREFERALGNGARERVPSRPPASPRISSPSFFKSSYVNPIACGPASCSHTSYYRRRATTSAPSSSSLCSFILAAALRDYPPGQDACVHTRVFDYCYDKLDEPDFLLRQWSALCIAQVWDAHDENKVHGVDRGTQDQLIQLLSDDSVEVRCAALALGTFMGASRTDDMKRSTPLDTPSCVFKTSALITTEYADFRMPQIRSENEGRGGVL